MPIAQALLPEFDHEMANTRKTLSRIPDDRLDWTPPPNREDRPPPLPRCSNTSTTINTLVMTNPMSSASFTCSQSCSVGAKQLWQVARSVEEAGEAHLGVGQGLHGEALA